MTAAEIAEPRRDARRRPFWLKLLVVGLLLLTGVVLLYGYLLLAADRRLREALAEADRLDPGWRLNELEAARAVVPEAENSATVLLAAHRVLPPQNEWPDYQLVEELTQLAPTERLPQNQVAILRAALDRAQPTVAKARELADARQGRYTIVWGPDVLNTLLPHVDAMSMVLRYLTCDVLVRLQDGDVEEALHTCRAEFQAARSVGDDPCAVVQMVRLFRGREAVTQVERCLAHGQASPATLEGLQRLVEEEAAEPFAWRCARGERALLHVELQSIQAGLVKVDVLQSLFSSKAPGLGNVAPSDFWYLRLPGAMKNNHAALLNYLTQFVEIARRPLEEQGPAVQELEALAAASGKPTVLVRLIGPVPKWISGNCQRGVAGLRCAAAMLAVERFRLARGRWPDRLEELVPAQLAAVPLDPFDGRPLRYCRLADGVVIYAIGPDGKDDGGNLSRAHQPPDGTDLGFRLWDLSARRLSAPGEKQAK
jgi:hypothetical protein